MLEGIYSRIKATMCDKGYEAYCPPKPTVEACQGVIDCYVKPYMPSVGTVAGVITATTAVAAAAYAFYGSYAHYQHKGKSADKLDGKAEVKADDISPVAPRRSARLNK